MPQDDPRDDHEAAPRNQDPAEGSRENVNVGEEADAHQSVPDKPALDHESPRPAPGTYHPE